METKQCSKCKSILTTEDFYCNKQAKDGLTYQCKNCQNKNRTEYYSKNRNKCLEYWKKLSAEELSERNKKRYYKDVCKSREKGITYQKKYESSEKGKKKKQASRKTLIKNILKTNPNYYKEIARIQTIKNNFKKYITGESTNYSKSEQHLQTTLAEFKEYVNSLLQESMTFDNYGEWILAIDDRSNLNYKNFYVKWKRLKCE